MPETGEVCDFAGSSAGAFGTHFNIHVVEGLLPSVAAAGNLSVFIDAGWMFEWDDSTSWC